MIGRCADKRVMFNIRSFCAGCGYFLGSKTFHGEGAGRTVRVEVPAAKAPCCSDKARDTFLRRREEKQ